VVLAGVVPAGREAPRQETQQIDAASPTCATSVNAG
jgi:hypothetical protein